MDQARVDGWSEGLRVAGARLAALTPEELAAPVPSCPGWDVAEVVRHVGGLHWWIGRRVAEAPGDHVPRNGAPAAPADPDGLLAWSVACHDELLRSLDAARTEGRLEAQLSTWAGPQPLWWAFRRMCHETTIHAWDAQDAARDEEDELDPELSIDAIDETFELFLPRRFDAAAFSGRGETIHLHATDAPGEWLVRVEHDGLVVTDEHAKGDVALRGPAASLLLALWNRIGLDDGDLEAFGDRELLARFRAAAAI